MNYWVISVRWQGVERSPINFLFATPFQAETYRLKISTAVGYQYAVRPATWQEREERMFLPGISAADGTEVPAVYTPPIWSEERWWEGVRGVFKEHFVHVSLVDPDTIAFTEDARKGEADRQTLMKPGKYLQKFLGAGPKGRIEHGPLKGQAARITKMQVAFYAAWHQAGKRPESEDALAFTEDPDEMVRVYEEGPESCMMGKGWSVEYHPVRVYAGGGLKMAYLTSVSGEVVARALCWPAREVFGRVYPTITNDTQRDHYDELMTRLKALGWKSITEDNTVFEGALLRRLTNRYGGYIMPYLDNDYGVEEVRREGEWWWAMTHSEDHQDNTDGTYTDGTPEPDWTCDACDEGFSDNYDSTCIYDRWVPSAGGRPGSGYGRGERYVCEDCRDYNTFYCDGSDEYFHEDAERVDPEDGCTYEANWFRANGGWTCVDSGNHYFENDDPPVRTACGATLHADYVEDACFTNFEDGKLYRIRFESKTVPGHHRDRDADDQHPVEYECVMPTMPDDPPDVEAWAAGHNLPTLLLPIMVSLDLNRMSLDDMAEALRPIIDISRMPFPVIQPISI